jgi:hypothetical protein
MSTTRAKARQAPPTRPRAAPEKNSTLLKNADDKPARYKPVNAGKGRVKGVPNAVTKSAREIFQAFIEGNAARVQELWDRVARKSPAKALVIYAKLAEFIIPKLSRAEIDAHLTAERVYPAIQDMSPEEATRVYMEMMVGRDGKGNANITFAPSVKPYVAPPKEPAPPSPPAAATAPRPAPAQPELPELPEQRRPKNVLVLEPAHPGEHQPIADSKCGFCRQLWADAKEQALDEALRHQRAPRVVT